MALSDDIKNRLKNLKPTQPVSTQQQQATSILQARSGKTAADSGPRASNIAEQVVTQQGNAALAGVQQQANQVAANLAAGQQGLRDQRQEAQATLDSQRRMTQEGLAAQVAGSQQNLSAQRSMFDSKLSAHKEMQLNEISARFDQHVKSLASEARVNEADIFQVFEQGQAELYERKDAARLEQLTFEMAMRDRAYLDSLARVGAMRQLQDELAFREEAARLTLSNNIYLLHQNIEWLEAYNASERAFAEQMSKMDINHAMTIANNVMAASNAQSVVSGVTSAVKTGVDHWAKNNSTNNSQPQTD